MITFSAPWALALLALPPAWLLWLRARRPAAVRFAPAAMLVEYAEKNKKFFTDE